MTTLKISMLYVFIFLLASNGYAQEDKSETRKTVSLEVAPEDFVLLLANINGNITIKPNTSNTIEFKVVKTITAKSSERLESGIKDVVLHYDDRKDTLLVFLQIPCQNFSFDHKTRWGYNWRSDECDLKYDYKFDFEVMVPVNANLHISTVNNGEIKVDGIKGNIHARNVNGGIEINGAEGPADVHTINGDVNLEYNVQPTHESRFYTLNGDINANFPYGLNAEMGFKSFNGDFYTNIEDITDKPVIMKKEIPEEEGISFKIGSISTIRARSGGVNLMFETFNGNVYVKEKTR